MSISSKIGFRGIYKVFAVAIALAFLYATVLVKLGFDWWTDENYSHGLLVPFVIGYIIWTEFENLKNAPKNPSLLIGGGAIAVAFLMLLAGTLGAELFIQRFSLILMLAGIVIYFFGTKVLKLLSVPFWLLLFAIPIPQIIFNKIAFPLQILASKIAIWGIRLFEIAPLRKGNVIEILPQGATQIVALEVVEACSGIRSLMTLATLGIVLWYFTREQTKFDWIRGLILVLAAVPIAIVTNAARVTGTGVLTYYYGKQAADGFTHDFSGWLVYLVALVLLIALNFLLKKLFFKESGTTSEKLPAYNTTVISRVGATWLVAALICGGLFINWFEKRGEAQISREPLKAMPANLGEWRQRGTDIRFSEQTESVLRTSDYVMREYSDGKGKVANVYVGYYASQKTGATYHSPQNCLPGSGWEMKQPELVEVKAPSGRVFTVNRYIIENGQYREVMIYWYQGRGRAVASEYTDKIYTVLDSVFRQRSDGAMVRVMTSVGNNEAESLKSAVDLAAQIADSLARFVPE